jgi:hypothetical protein
VDKPLGKLEPVNLDAYWENEAQFTAWLARPDNLNLLGDAIGLGELEPEGTEQDVGHFRADIVARDTQDKVIVIENQLGKTNHDHPGKSITYAAGKGASYIVWIARELRPEHRQALDWLNQVTGGEAGFFGAEIQLWRIGNSLAAPQFGLISQPNTWAKAIKETQAPLVAGQTTRTKELQLRFWTEFAEFCKRRGTFLSLPRPAPRLSYPIALGKTDIWLSLTFKITQQTLGCEVAIVCEQSKLAFELLQQQRAEIEKELGDLQWDSPAEDGKFGKIAQFRNADLENPDVWPELFPWLKEKAEAFHRVFSPRVRALKLQFTLESALESAEETE